MLQLFSVWTRTSYHADGLAGSHVIVVGVPPLEFWVLSMLQNVLLAPEVRVVKADPGSALHTDGVHPEDTHHVIRTGSIFELLGKVDLGTPQTS